MHVLHAYICVVQRSAVNIIIINFLRLTTIPYKMAELLGGQSIIESLSNDVQDLQWAINEIVSRIGPVQHSSWKFPDQLSCDLDIEDLLDLYSYSDDEEESQVAHIALYELVIDRLVHIFTKFTDIMY